VIATSYFRAQPQSAPRKVKNSLKLPDLLLSLFAPARDKSIAQLWRALAVYRMHLVVNRRRGSKRSQCLYALDLR
jgi:hypothetical protein